MSNYQDQKKRAWSTDPSVRTALASAPDTLPEILYFLAEDDNISVRHQVALNTWTPRHADLLLATDTHSEIRSDLAKKIARLTPDLSDQRRDTLYELTEQALEILAKDQLVRVREILSDALKDHPNAPNGVIMTLARDASLSVASPVLEFSPVLSDQDLLDIIDSQPIQGAMSAISRRTALAEAVSDAIARSDDDDAIASLLNNKSIQIREETLDFIITRAPEKTLWHEPLVMRPNLNSSAARRIGSFIAKKLLDKLRKRDDLSEETLAAVESVVEARLSELSAAEVSEPKWAQEDDLEEQVSKMYAKGTLTQEVLEDALAAGKKRFVLLALAQSAQVSSESINRIVASRSAKAIVALTWSAGFNPHFSVQLQTQLIGLNPNNLMRSEGGGWPLTPNAMQWQMEFYEK